MAGYADHLLALAVASALFGAGAGYVYTCHLCYGLAGGGKRTHITALHEGLLAIGFVTGPLVGGFISDYFANRRLPYLFAVGLIIVSLAIQTIIWRRQRGDATSRQSNKQDVT